MDEKVARVIAAYQTRAETEAALPDAQRNVDELLLPIGRAAATFVNLLIKEAGAKAVLEIGTSYGYSTIWLAEAVRETGGRLTTLELHAYKAEHASEQLARAGLAEHVDVVVGDATETLTRSSGPFDFVLLDLWKSLYVPCFDAFYPKLSAGAFVVADNMLFPPSAREAAAAYRARVRAAAGMTSVLLPIGSGLELSRFR